MRNPVSGALLEMARTSLAEKKARREVDDADGETMPDGRENMDESPSP